MASVPPGYTEINPKGPDSSYLGKYYTKMTIGEYSRPKPFVSSEFKTNTIIFFPLPMDLRDSTSVGYTQENLETVGDLLNSQGSGGSIVAAAALRNAGPLIKSTAGNLIGAAAQTYSKGLSGVLDGPIGKNASNLLGDDQITSAVQQYTGLAPNPNPSVMFTGPELRTFSHSWTFYPNHEQESLNLQKIIKTLKKCALPENKFFNSAAVLKYPNMVQLNFYPWDEKGKAPWGWNDETSILKYKKCVMRNVSVNYTPGGSPGFFHKTHGPVATTITIEFMELEYMLSGDWGGIFNSEAPPGSFEPGSDSDPKRKSKQAPSSPMAFNQGPGSPK